MSEVLVSPAERGAVLDGLVHAGIDYALSSIPERFGCDFAWLVEQDDDARWYGAQRKTHKDFLASLNDGRLAREVAQIAHMIEHPTLILEGVEHWNLNDTMAIGRQTVTRTQWIGTQLSLAREHGLCIMHTRDAHHTGGLLAVMIGWSNKRKHNTAFARPKPIGEWGKASSAEWAAHLLQGFEGIGPDTARAIVKHFQGVPLSWDVDEAELRKVPGVGKTRAAAMISALNRRIK